MTEIKKKSIEQIIHERDSEFLSTSDDSIEEEVYSLLWELFKDECPYFNNAIFASFITRMKGRSEYNQLWTIISEILPSEIHYNNGYHFKQIVFCLSNEHIYHLSLI